jgi:tetratricopeptide (TPR) repeat protein
MQKYIQTTVIASTLLLAAIASSTVHAKTASEIYEQAAKSTVVVGNFDAKGKQQSMGSGVVMPDGDVVTNCHVVKGASRLTVRVGQTERPATLRYSDWDRDVCALSSTGLNAPSATVGSSKTLKVGAKVYAIGAPKGLELTLSDGIVSSLRDLDGGRYIQTTAAISPGSSGGGLYDDNGALVGLTTFYFTEGQNLNFAVPIDWVKELPKRNIKTQQTGQTTTAWLSKAIDLEIRNDWPGMLAHTLSWTKAQSDNDQAWFGLGNSYYENSQYTQAIYAFQQTLRINPKFANAWFNLGGTYDRIKQYPQAIDAYRQALRIDPDYASAWNNLGATYSNAKQHPQAVGAFQEAINAFIRLLHLNPEDAPSWFRLGNLHHNIKQHLQAIDAYKQALVIDPDNADYWNAIGKAYDYSQQRPQAINAYQQALRINPSLAVVWKDLASAYLLSQQFPQAIDALQQALRIDPEDAAAWSSLGFAHSRTSNRAKVLEIYKKLRVLDAVQAEKYFNVLILPGG